MKKIISAILLLVFCYGFVAPVYALGSDLQHIGSEALDGVRAIGSDYYLLDDNNEILDRVGRVDLDLSNRNEIEDFLTNSEVEKEVKDYIRTLEKRILDGEIEGCYVTVFSPELIYHKGNASPKSSITDYYTYNGMEMKRERVYTYNISTGYHFVSYGTSTLSIANAISQFFFYVASSLSKVFNIGTTLLDLFETAAGGTVAYASSNDYSQVNLKYDGVNQWVYGKLDGTNWYLGYYAQKITLNQVIIEQQFVVNGVGTTKTSYKSSNIVCKPSSFDSPWAKAYLNLGNPVDETVSYKLYSTSFYFA